MTTTANDITYRLEQKRRVQADFPGPKSVALTERRKAVVAAGVASSVPVYVADADGGIIHDVDGNSFIDLGSGIAVTSVGASDPAVVGAVKEAVEHFTHTCFMVTPYEGYVAVAEQLNRLTPGDHEKRTVLFNSGAEAVENAVKVARLATGRDAVVAFDHAYHGRTNLTMALTAKAMPYKTNFGPFAPEVYRMPMSYPFREENPEITGAEAAKRAITMIEKQIGGESGRRDHHRTDPGRGRLHRPGRGLPAGAGRLGQGKGHRLHRRRGPVRLLPHRRMVRRQPRGRRSGHHHHGQGHRRRHAAVRDHRPRRPARRRPPGRPGRHLRRQPGGLRRGAGRPSAPWRSTTSTPVPSTSRNWPLGRLRELQRAERTAASSATSAAAAPCSPSNWCQAGSKEPNPELTKAVAAACLKEGVIILTCGTYGNVIRLLPPLVISDELLQDGLEVLAAAINAPTAYPRPTASLRDSDRIMPRTRVTGAQPPSAGLRSRGPLPGPPLSGRRR